VPAMSADEQDGFARSVATLREAVQGLGLS
jgi:hypothetical protein